MTLKNNEQIIIFGPYDLEIWWMTLKNNRAHLLCYIKLCAPFRSHQWVQTFITHAPLFRGGEDHVCELPLGDSCFVMNIHNPFMHCVTSQYVFKLGDVIMLMRAVTIVAAYKQQHRPLHRYHVASLLLFVAQWRNIVAAAYCVKTLYFSL